MAPRFLQQLSKSQWAILFSCLSMFALGSVDNVRGPLFADLLKFFQLSNSQGSFSFALTSTASFVGNTAAVFLLQRIVINRLLSWAVLFLGVGSLVMGWSSNFSIYLVGAFLLGLSFGILAVCQNLLIAENIEEKKQTKVLSGLHGIYGLSSLLAPFIASRAPTWFQGSSLTALTEWRSAFFIMAGGGLLVAALGFITKPQTELHFVKKSNEVTATKSKFSEMFLIAIFFSFYVAAEILVSTRLALYMRTYFNMNLEQSSNYVTYFFVFLLLGRLIFTFKSFQLSLKTQLNVSLASSILFLGLGLWLHPFLLTMVGLTMAPFYPMAIAYIAEITGSQMRRFLTFAIGVQSLCVISMHLGVGYITDQMGLVYAFAIGAFLLTVAILCLNTHPKIQKN